MKKMLIAVFSFLAIVVGVVVFVIMLYIPREETILWSENGIAVEESGAISSCTVGLGGTLKTYRMNTRLPYFSTNPYSSREGLSINGEQYVASVSFNWQDGRDIIRFCRNGFTFFTDRNFSFVVVIAPVSRQEDMLLVAPAKTPQQALDVLDTLMADPYMHSSWKSEYTYLQSMVQHLR